MSIKADCPSILPLPSLSADCARQRARLLSSSMRQLLAHRFQASLAGSWATNEAHMPRPMTDLVRSLSDVDILVDESPTVDKSTAIAHSVLNLARQHGIMVSKVSVRRRSEIDAFWNPCRLSALAESKVESGRFLTFWALIGAIEALSSSPDDSAVDGRAYFLIKFFFKLCRNVLLIRQCGPRSYRELTSAVFSKLISHPGVRRAYAIKIGHEVALSSAECEEILSDSTWGPVTDALIDAHSRELMADLRRDLRMWYRTGISLDVESYLTEIRTFDEWPELLPARAKVVYDYERRSAGSAT